MTDYLLTYDPSSLCCRNNNPGEPFVAFLIQKIRGTRRRGDEGPKEMIGKMTLGVWGFIHDFVLILIL
jgi:hypothetical protein